MSSALSFFAWSFLPNLVTTYTLKVWYRLITRVGDPLPVPGTQRYARDYRRLHLLVIASYLLYTVYESYHVLRSTPNFYDLLDVPLAVDASALRTRFRRMSVMYHPDKAGAAGGDYFVVIKQAYDTLSDPAKRFAYDRFGPEMLEWKHCASMYDYLVRGGAVMVPYYVGTGLFLVILTVLGKAEFGRYWRFFTFFSLITLEALILTRPFNLLSLLPRTFRLRLLPFEQLSLARKICISVFIAISQMGPLLMMNQRSPSDSIEPQLDRLFQAAKVADLNATSLLKLECQPFEGEDGGKDLINIERKVREWYVENSVRKDPEVRDATGRVLERRRMGVPVGAKGAR